MITLQTLRMVGVASLTLLAVLACSSSQKDWSTAAGLNTVDGYQRFIAAHPKDKLSVQAQSRIDDLRDERAWDAAEKLGTMGALQQYLRNEPSGTHVLESRDQIAGLRRTAAWNAASANGTAQALEVFLESFPNGKEADEARSRLRELQADHFRVQVAAFRTQRAADHALTRLQVRYAKVLHDIAVEVPSGKRKLVTIRSGQMDREGAQAACRTIRKEHHVCEVIEA